MQEEYGDDLESFLTFQVFQEVQGGGAVQCDYRSIGTFNGDADSIPSSSELDDVISQAFSDPDLQGYLERVNDLSDANAFATTESISHAVSAAQSSTTSEESFPYGLAAAGAAILFLTASGIANARLRKKRATPSATAGKLNADPSSDSSMTGTISINLEDSTSPGIGNTDSEAARET